LYQNKQSHITRKSPSGKLPPMGPEHPEFLLDIHMWWRMISWQCLLIVDSYWSVCKWAYPSVYTKVTAQSIQVRDVVVFVTSL